MKKIISILILPILFVPNFVFAFDLISKHTVADIFETFDVFVQATNTPIVFFNTFENSIGDQTTIFFDENLIGLSIDEIWGEPLDPNPAVFQLVEYDVDDPEAQTCENFYIDCINSTAFISEALLSVVPPFEKIGTGIYFFGETLNPTSDDTASNLTANVTDSIGSIFPIVVLSISLFLVFFVMVRVMSFFDFAFSKEQKKDLRFNEKSARSTERFFKGGIGVFEKSKREKKRRGL